MKDKDLSSSSLFCLLVLPLLLKSSRIFKGGEGVGGRKRGKEEEGLGGKEAKSERRKKK